MANDYLGTDLPDAPMTFVEFHGVERFEMAGRDEMDDLRRARRELTY